MFRQIETLDAAPRKPVQRKITKTGNVFAKVPS